MAKTAFSKQRLLTGTFKPTAVVTYARFIGDNGNHPNTLGARCIAIAQDSWNAEDIAIAARDLSGNTDGLTGTAFGFEELEVDAAYSTPGLELTADASNRGKAAVSTNWVNALLFGVSTAAGDRVMVLKIVPYLKA
jgi:hypothetical protein